MATFTSAALKVAYTIQRKIESLEAKLQKHANKLATVLGGEKPGPTKRGKNKMSAAGRARIAAAQRARWAKVKAGGKPAKKGKRKMSASAKKAISLAAKLRWKKAKAAGKNSL
jgi:hypothetical protein